MGDDHLDVTVRATDGSLVTRWVTVAEIITPDGTEALNIETSDGLAEWTMLGMLQFAINVQGGDVGE